MKILFALASYLLGSVPTGYLLVRWTGREDVRDLGSGNTGATNVLRVKGWKAALPVAVFDVLKGFLPAFLALRWFADPGFAALCGLFAVAGHCYPFSIGFRGGKGVATSFGAFVAIALWPSLAGLGVFLVAVGVTGYVSLGSILGSLAFPAVLAVAGGPWRAAAASAAIAGLVVLRHSGNIVRLLAGRERKLGEKAS
ncbi:MAG TPA: glycerol-3-phosphate 1-O-acyltransferase PlsY [Candidatus Aminicenantes bacterium]|nr:glycerol-3-phosphate 1-O-acyltransferase PlsY [Candidatus Aminicenantes bacterium]